MADKDNSTGVASRAEEFLNVFKKGAEFTQGLLKENERLRYRVLELEQQLRDRGTVDDLQMLEERLQKSEIEKHEILSKISMIEQENLNFSNRYSEIEAENNLLANLYITTYQLHSTFNANEIVHIIEEILLNLVGAERFSILLREEDGQMVQPLIDATGDPGIVEVEVNDPQIKAVLKSGQAWIASEKELAHLGEVDAKAVIPLQVDGRVIGALTIYGLLVQKKSFTEIDGEIFGLLGGHAAMALSTAVLRHENSNPVSFRQGFLA